MELLWVRGEDCCSFIWKARGSCWQTQPGSLCLHAKALVCVQNVGNMRIPSKTHIYQKIWISVTTCMAFIDKCLKLPPSEWSFHRLLIWMHATLKFEVFLKSCFLSHKMLLNTWNACHVSCLSCPKKPTTSPLPVFSFCMWSVCLCVCHLMLPTKYIKICIKKCYSQKQRCCC